MPRASCGTTRCLFDVDKFSGWDRIETGTRANLGLQYTFQAKRPLARFIAGQSFHLAGENPYTNPGVDETAWRFLATQRPRHDRSDYVLGAYLAPVSTFRIVTQARLDEGDLSLRRQDTSVTTSLDRSRPRYSTPTSASTTRLAAWVCSRTSWRPRRCA